MIRLLSLLLMMSVSLTACAKNDKLNKEIAEKGNLFAFNFMQQVLTQDTTSGTVVISPLSCSMALSMLLNGADGESYTQITKALHLDNFTRDEINIYNRQLLQVLGEKDPGVLLEIANSVWIANDFSVKCSFKRTLKKNYKVSPYRVDMSMPSTKDKINQWCSDATHGLIEEIIDSTDPSLLMVLINAVYFKGDWEIPFEEEASVEDIFYGVNGESKVTYMNNYTSVPYFASDEFRMVELPYTNPDYSMTLVLPSEGICMGEFLKEFSVDKFYEGVNSLSVKKTYLTIPKLDCEFEIKLNEVLQDMGMVQPFTSAANLSKIANTPMFVSSVIQKCALKVNEQGSEAAAVTAINIMKTSLSHEEPPRFIANRPYLMYIRERSTGTILFMALKRD